MKKLILATVAIATLGASAMSASAATIIHTGRHGVVVEHRHPVMIRHHRHHRRRVVIFDRFHHRHVVYR